MSKVVMTTARHRYTDGTTELVQLPGTPYMPEHFQFDPAYHTNLICRYCEAGVHLNEGSEAIAGSFRGRAQHFHTNPGETHTDCLWLLRDHTQKQQDIDETKGYRLHINTLHYSDVFNRHSGVYGRNARGHIYARDPDLKDREAISIRSVGDVITLMKNGDSKRLSDSKIIFSNRAVKWEEFCLYLDKRERYAAMVERLRAAGKFGPAQPVLMEMNLADSHYSDALSSQSQFNAKRIWIGTDRRGLPEYVVPGISIQHDHDTYMRDLFDQKGNYMLLCTPRLNTRELDHVTYHYFNIDVRDVVQVYFGNIRDIAKVAKHNASKREKGPQLALASP